MSLAELMQQYVDMKGFDQLEGIAKTEIEGLYFYRSSQGKSLRYT